MADSLIGTTLGTNYRVLHRIGAGGMGVVYMVEHVTLKKRFAAKVLHPDLVRLPEAVARFEAEAHAASKLDHVNIVEILDYGHSSGTSYLVMELLKGRDLMTRMQEGPVPHEEILSIIVAVCQALGAAHRAGIVHRDMKPENVFLAERGLAWPVVKVLDFGISQVRDLGHDPAQGRLTKQGQVLGSPTYMSPEACQGSEVDARSDVYSVGVMLYELFCGRPPFVADNHLKLLYAHACDAPPPPRQLRPDLSEQLEAVLLRALAKDPNERCGSMAELEVELCAAMPEVVQHPRFLPAYTPPAGLQLSDSMWGAARATPAGTPLPASPTPGLASQGLAATAAGTAKVEPARPAKKRAPFLVAIATTALAGVAAIAYVLTRPASPSSAGAPPVEDPSAVVEASGAAAGAPPVADEAPEPAGEAEPRAPLPEPEVAPAPPPMVSLVVHSRPSGASVSLDGNALGQTPLTITLPLAASGQLEVRLPGHRPERRELSLDKDTQVSVKLRRVRAAPADVPRPAPSPPLDIKDRR